MRCPRDMSELLSSTYEDVQVERCPLCGGRWLDPGELERIEEERRKPHVREAVAEPNVLAEAVHRVHQENEQRLLCPICTDPMERREALMASQVMVDVCVRGHGTWVDPGELRRLEVFVEQMRLEDHGPGVLGTLRRALKL